MAYRRLSLTREQRTTLEQLRDHGPRPYLRERAAALLKIAAGQRAAVVARRGLLRRRDPDTLYDWLDRYQAAGLAGLYIRRGRGRKPAFSPSAPGRGGGQGGAAAPAGARAAPVRAGPHPLDAGRPARRLPLAAAAP